MKLETERLYLIPLGLEDLKQAIEDRDFMARSLGLDDRMEPLEEMMKIIYRIKIQLIEKSPESLLFCTYWQLVLKAENRIIGEAGFKGEPMGEEGIVEVGYGLEAPYQKKGYMTEALRELMRWAFSQEQAQVSMIIACTEKENLASQKVLQRVGMEKFDENEETLLWRIRKDHFLGKTEITA